MSVPFILFVPALPLVTVAFLARLGQHPCSVPLSPRWIKLTEYNVSQLVILIDLISLCFLCVESTKYEHWYSKRRPLGDLRKSISSTFTPLPWAASQVIGPGC